MQRRLLLLVSCISSCNLTPPPPPLVLGFSPSFLSHLPLPSFTPSYNFSLPLPPTPSPHTPTSAQILAADWSVTLCPRIASDAKRRRALISIRRVRLLVRLPVSPLCWPVWASVCPPMLCQAPCPIRVLFILWWITRPLSSGHSSLRRPFIFTRESGFTLRWKGAAVASEGMNECFRFFPGCFYFVLVEGLCTGGQFIPPYKTPFSFFLLSLITDLFEFAFCSHPPPRLRSSLFLNLCCLSL